MNVDQLPRKLKEKFITVRKSVSLTLQSELDDALLKSKTFYEFQDLLEHYLDNISAEIDYIKKELLQR